jgi:glutathione S-transferase
MKLYFSPASPFVRKVRVVALELGLHDKIELVRVNTTPLAPDKTIAKANPLIKIPALETDDGLTLYDSRVICEYLDSLSSDIALIPADGPDRWRIKRQVSLIDGLMDALILTRYEQALRPADKRWNDWIEGQMRKVAGAVKLLEEEADSFLKDVNMASIGLGCALGYMEFRFPEIEWEGDHPKIAAWYDEWDERPSMRETDPETAGS